MRWKNKLLAFSFTFRVRPRTEDRPNGPCASLFFHRAQGDVFPELLCPVVTTVYVVKNKKNTIIQTHVRPNINAKKKKKKPHKSSTRRNDGHYFSSHPPSLRARARAWRVLVACKRDRGFPEGRNPRRATYAGVPPRKFHWNRHRECAYGARFISGREPLLNTVGTL